MRHKLAPLFTALGLLAALSLMAGCEAFKLGGGEPAQKPKVVEVKPEPDTPPPPPKPSDYDHVIQYPGETLALISLWYTGSVNNWQQIMEHNGVTDPAKLQLGQTLKIPGELVTRREPLPQEYITKSTAKAKQKQAEEQDEAAAPAQAGQEGQGKPDPWQTFKPAGPK